MTGPPRDPLEIRRTFTLLEPLGEGAMGEVFAALDSETGQRYAVKMLRTELVGDERTRAYFLEEASITSAIDHPGGIPVYGLGTTADGRPFYVMKRVEGRTLRSLLDERGAHVSDLIWRQRLLRLFAAVCETVAYAHVRGIVHRDLKPDNVLVGEQGAVTVIDWGLAKRAGRAGSGAAPHSRTAFGDVLGSPGYMAPEQASGDSAQAGPAADVFSLGAMLYEILTGMNPFPGATPRESMLASIHRDPNDPRRTTRWLWLSHSLVGVCRKALEKQPEKRYANAGDLARDLRALASGEPASATRPALIERVRWAAKRRPVTFASVTALTAALAFALILVVGQLRIDARLAEKALEQVASRDRQIELLSRRLRELEGRTSAATDPKARRALEIERGQIQLHRLLEQIDSIYLLRDVAQLRFIRRDPFLLEMAKVRLFVALEWAIDLGEPAMAKAMAEALLEREGEEGPVADSLTAAERQRVIDLIERADRAFAEAMRNKSE